MVQEVAHAAESAGLLGTLGIDYKLFLAQLVNFGIVLLVIWKFVYGPLMKVLDERSAKIEQGLKDAAASASLKATSEEEKSALVAEARAEARTILEKAEVDAQTVTDEKIAKTKTEVERIVTQGKDQLRSEREKMIAEVKAEMADLVIAATERVAGERLDSKKDKALIEKALADTEA